MSADPHLGSPAPAPEIIEAAAAAWLSLRDRGMSAAETAEFVRWLQQDPQHAVVFEELDRVWKDFDRLGVVPAPVAAGAPAPDGDLLAPRARPRFPRRLAWGALGAAAAALLVWVSVTQFSGSRLVVETGVGAFQKLDLPDGSVAQLNTASAIETDFSATARRVRLVRGEVHFSVTKDAARPFIVTVGPVSVQAVGTAFNVRQRDSTVEVLVTEGRVRIDETERGQSLLAPAGTQAEAPQLVAGERAVVAVSPAVPEAAPARATVTKMSVPEVKRALAWQERRLEFDAVPLAEVVREFNRYNRTQLAIADAELALKRFSGTFRADGYESLVRLLEADFGVSVVRRPGEILLQGRR